MKIPYGVWLFLFYVCFPVVLIRQIIVDSGAIHARHDWLEYCYRCGSYVKGKE